MTLNTIIMTKEALIERLQAQLPLMEKRDEKVLAEHRKDEQASLKAFRDLLREMLKWDYATARNQGFEVPYARTRAFKASCPTMLAPRAKRSLELIAVDHRQRYSLSPDGSMASLYELVTWSENPIDLSGGCR